MGGLTSRFSNKDDDDREDVIKKYEERIFESDGAVGYLEEEKKEVRWWERAVFDKRFRILYVLILAVLLGIIIPFIIYIKKLETDDRTIYGSCLINENARFQCLINAEEESEEACIDALCCWENSNALPFKCYHSFPSAYQYSVSDIRNDIVNGTEWTTLEVAPRDHEDKMTKMQVMSHWDSQNHLVIEVFDPSRFPGRGPTQNVKDSGKSGETFQEVVNPPLTVSMGDEGNYFYIRIGRRDTGETIFDTRLGPIYSTQDYITFATVLPTPFFYGLRGGQATTFATVTFGVVNGFENAELPYYIAYENGGRFHGVLIETEAPMLTQVLQAPGIMFHLETDLPEINLHFFAGPTQAEILQQLHEHIRKKHEITHLEPMIPPYWGLGLHLCRKGFNESVVLDEIKDLVHENKSTPYDSDCIDDYLRHPFTVDPTQYENLREILELLELNSKKILLSQKVSAEESQLADDMCLQDITNSSDIKPFAGEVDNMVVNYIDVFNPNLEEFPTPPTFTYHGIALTDNFPKTYKPTEICSDPKSRIQSLFTSPFSTTSSLNSSYFWGSLCPNKAVHAISGEGGVRYVPHVKRHNTFGHQSLKLVHKTLQNQAGSDEEMLITSTSTWISSMYYGGSNGLQAPFSWRGLQDSVAYTVRNYALVPIAGTPICGTTIFNMSTTLDNELCLRWFQFGLLLPIARNSYDGISSYGPLHLSAAYQRNLREVIRARYTYAPYYYTTLDQYRKTPYFPFLRPMSFEFNGRADINHTFPILDQFMIGEAVLAVPIIEMGQSRQAYFPGGLWYNMEGEVAYNRNVGSMQQIQGFITQTPMFLRSGYIIPTLQDPVGTSIEESLQGKYTLLIALSGTSTSSGSLVVKQPGGTSHVLNFQASIDATNTTTFRVNSTCGMSTSNSDKYADVGTVIHQIRIFGHPYTEKILQRVISWDRGNATDPITCAYRGEHKALRISNMNLDWCLAGDFEMIITPDSTNPPDQSEKCED